MAQNRIFINQAGYLPTEEKFAYTDEGAKDFSLINAGSGRRVFPGTFTLRKSEDSSTGLTIYQADFSAFQTPG